MLHRIRSTAVRAARDAAYLILGLLTSILALVVWIAGVSVSASLAVFVVGIPIFVAVAIVFRWVAALDRLNAALVVGAPLGARNRVHRGHGLRGVVGATARDPQTWRDLAWLVVHSVLGLASGIVAVSLLIAIGWLASMPIWYWAIPDDGVEMGLWNVQTLGIALATAPLAIPVALVTVGVLRVLALGQARLAIALLGRPGTVPAPPGRTRRERVETLTTHAAVVGVIGLVCTLIWGVTSAGYYWPAWVWLGLGLTVALHGVAVRAVGGPALRVLAELCGVIALLCIVIWAFAGFGYFWPAWPMLGMGAALALPAVIVFRDRLPWVRERELTERVDELTRTRRGALDVQAAELRRIERDLHDGAQARLVSLSILMGRAEEQLADQPQVASLVRQAREEAGAAIGELRDLARGIAPPVLADRGLAAAAQALATRAPMDATVDAADLERLPPVVETAAYFVVAEALTNVAKHAGGAPAHVRLAREGDLLVVEVADEGPGGADPRGTGLTGLRHRVEALDGTLRVAARPGGGTTIRAELPCGS